VVRWPPIHRGTRAIPLRAAAARQDEAILLRCVRFGDGKVFARFGLGFGNAVLNFLLAQEAAEQLPGKTADGENGLDLAAESLDHAREIDSSTAWITLLRRAPQLARRHDAFNGRR
jgi:hypothetical protein